VSEYWVIDLNAQTVYVHRTPLDGAYRLRTVMVRGGEVSAQFAPAVLFTIDEMLG
jgi:Uma2 family endonuclease